MNAKIQLAETTEKRERLLSLLKQDSARNAHIIEDFIRWPRRSKFYFIEEEGSPLSFLHISGHPGHKEPVIILDGDPEKVAILMSYVKPEPPFVVRETPAEFVRVVSDYYPDVKVYVANRMNVERDTFRAAHRGLSRQLDENDIPALEKFFEGSHRSALGLPMWIKGVRAFHGIFDGDELVSMGSSMISLPEVWNLISVETLPEYRGRGYATEIMSSLTTKALEETGLVTLSVVHDNYSAIRIYERLGYKAVQKCMWADCGAGVAP